MSYAVVVELEAVLADFQLVSLYEVKVLVRSHHVEYEIRIGEQLASLERVRLIVDDFESNVFEEFLE